MSAAIEFVGGPLDGRTMEVETPQLFITVNIGPMHSWFTTDAALDQYGRMQVRYRRDDTDQSRYAFVK